MAPLDFTWDPDKAQSNRRKHGVTFEEAQSVFLDENARLIHIQITPSRKTGSCYWALAKNCDY